MHSKTAASGPQPVTIRLSQWVCAYRKHKLHLYNKSSYLALGSQKTKFGTRALHHGHSSTTSHLPWLRQHSCPRKQSCEYGEPSGTSNGSWLLVQKYKGGQTWRNDEAQELAGKMHVPQAVQNNPTPQHAASVLSCIGQLRKMY
jgi:hypothetical protein